MRIAFLLQDTGLIYGAERATLSLVRELSANSHVSVLVLLMRETRLTTTSPILSDAFAETGATVEHIAVDRAFSIPLLRAVRHLLKTHDIDILHTVGYKADLHGLWAGRWAGVPVVSTVHGWLFRPDLKERFYERLNLLTLKRMRRVIVLSRFYDDLLQQRGVARDRIRLIPSGMPTPGGARVRPRTGPLVIGMLGRLSYEKNQHMFLQALASLRQRHVDACGVLAGTGPDEPPIRDAIEEMGLTDRVRLVGYMNSDDFFREVDVLVICSRIENLSYSVLEAMASGVPVVATRVGGLPDLVADGVNGYLVALDDALMLADRLDTLAQRPDLREQLGAAGQQRIRDEFALHRCVQSHMELYQELGFGDVSSFT